MSRPKRSIFRRIVTRLVLVGAICIGGLFFMSYSTQKPDGSGVTNGRLTACPDSMNCICSQVDVNDPHFIAPLPYIDGSGEQTRERIVAAIRSLPRAQISEESRNYIQAQCTSLLFRFVDDLECYFDDDAKLVHFRSASRVGKSDLGVNRKRVEQLKAAVQESSHAGS